MTPKNSVSMRDVATLAQVSVGTVSNVLNSPDRVAEATRQRVQAAIEKLGWVPNESARQLRAGRSRSIGMVVMDIANPFFTDVARGAEELLYGEQYSVQIGNSDQDPGREITLLDRFEQQRVGGVLFAPIDDSVERLVRLRQRGIPVVIVDRVGSSVDFCSVGVDDLAGGRLAGQHLLDQGHHRLAFVGGPSSLAQVRDRRRGMELAVEQAGGDVSLLAVSTPTLSLEAGVSSAGEIAALPTGERPTAVFAANDLVAIGLLQGFVTAGLRVPDDVAIIGYDDIAFAAAAAVPLSSVRQPREDIGRKSAELLVREIEAADSGAPHRHEAVRFTPQLIARRSTQPRKRAKG
ncbi:MAG: LacI family transcriptional regulator [Actinobacteria bacterium HGW-Actinobacteria-5]|jgi:LacI family transcriptional regulator|nr:MAG: LacI family transcriptional regulator [Actinobacteria bacterium HGW-Actinobacteria-5]